MARSTRTPRWVKIRSKNHTANQLRRAIRSRGKNVILRLGSKTPTERITRFPVDLELNRPEACILSNNKIRMKQAFDLRDVKTSNWSPIVEHMVEGLGDPDPDFNDKWEHYPAIIKHKNSSAGNGLSYINSPQELQEFIDSQGVGIRDYIIERYYTYMKEYRLHVNADGCFYACRKMLKRDAEERWHRHDNNSVWILEENEAFDKPSNWNDIVNECVKAMEAVGLDICAVDVKTQSRENPDFIILETNSAPALGEVGAQKYIQEIERIINTL